MLGDTAVRQTRFGRYQVSEPMRFDLLHLHDGAPLKEVSWTIPIPVLDQEDLLEQGIDTATLIPGAQQVDALGSCTANATTASLAERLHAADNGKFVPGKTAVDFEEWAIGFYHVCTDQTGDPSQEWPPTDCGSTGLYCCQELEKQRMISSYKTASGALNLLSLLQAGTVIQGTPFLNAWMSPDSQGFIDGDGSMEALEAAIKSGVAGGHETCVHAIVQLAQAQGKPIELEKTVVQVRNSWSDAWGLSGDFRLHASTLQWLSQYVDFKQFVI